MHGSPIADLSPAAWRRQAAHKTPRIEAWLTRRPCQRVHLTQTSVSWINQVERWIAELTRKKIQRGVHTSVRQLEADIKAFIEAHNEDQKLYGWLKSAAEILASVKRFCQKAEATLCGKLWVQMTKSGFWRRMVIARPLRVISALSG